MFDVFYVYLATLAISKQALFLSYHLSIQNIWIWKAVLEKLDCHFESKANTRRNVVHLSTTGRNDCVPEMPQQCKGAPTVAWVRKNIFFLLRLLT